MTLSGAANQNRVLRDRNLLNLVAFDFLSEYLLKYIFIKAVDLHLLLHQND